MTAAAFDLTHFEIDANGDYAPRPIATTPVAGSTLYWGTDATGDLYLLPVPTEVPMPAVTPSGPMAGPVAILAAMLAACPSWQSWTDVDDATAAAAHIFQEAVPYPDGSSSPSRYLAHLRSLRPFAVVYQADDWGFNINATGNAIVRGRIGLQLEAEVATGYDGEEYLDLAMIDYQNKVGAVLTELAALSGTSGSLIITGVDLVEGPSRASRERSASEGDWILSAYDLTYGVSS